MEDREAEVIDLQGARREAAMPMPGTLRLGRVSGIQVGIHYTWFIVFALITYSLAAGFFPSIVPDLAPATYWLMGAAGALLLFVSVLIHELSHSLVAQSRGLPVQSITLFIFGGVSNISEEAKSPGDEFLVAFVGPLSSLALGGLFWGLYLLTGPTAGPISAVLFYLAIVNVILAVFNLLPGFPLDGGRVLRAIIWAITGSLRRATNWASAVGQFLAFVLIFLGVLQIFAGDFLGGLWIAFIGWFLNGAAESSRQQLGVQEAFQGVRVSSLMTPNPPVVEPTLPVRVLVDDYALRRGIRALLVGTDGQLIGIATLTDVRKLPPERRGDATVGEIMTRAPLIAVEPDTELTRALNLMGEHDLNQLPVIDRGRLVGLLTRSNVLRFLRFREELGIPPTHFREEEERRRAA